MARTNATNFTGGLQFPYATAATDIFKKEDIQTLAQAVDQHDHTAGKGVAVNTTPAAGSITNAQLGHDVARANLLANPGFEIWQRGSGAFTGFVYGADRWSAGGAVGDTISISRDTTNVDTGSGACAAVTFTKGTGTTGLTQTLEPASLLGRVLSLSVRVRTATANAVRVGIYNGSAWTYSSYHSGSGTYQTLTVSATVASVALVQAGVWFDASCTAYLDNASLVVGSQAADYVPLHPADELARCLRYYEKLAYGANEYVTVGQAYATNNAVGTLPYMVTKPVAPTLTTSGGFQLAGATFGLLAVTTMSPSASSANRSLQFTATVASGLVAGNASTVLGGASGGSIAVEGNP